MKKVGITGQNGFLGSHLSQTLNLFPKEFQIIEFQRKFFNEPDHLDEFVKQCDVIVHLAGLNRHEKQETLYKTNVDLALKLTAAFARTGKTPHVIFSSSTQECRENPYGLSKRESRETLASWAEKTGHPFTGMIIPNVFGPFGRPHYNSVVATFCHQISHGEEAEIKSDALLKLVYVAEVVELILNAIRKVQNAAEYHVPSTASAKVSQILGLLRHYKDVYQDRGEIPTLQNEFERQLFNTYRCFIPSKHYFPKMLTKHEDHRGHFVEIARLGIGGQMSFSTTLPGVTRGNHFHTRKIERFAVIKGKARIQLRRVGTNEVMNFDLDGENPSYVDMPIWHTHNITNTGDDELLTVFWVDEPYDPEDPDTYYVTV